MLVTNKTEHSAVIDFTDGIITLAHFREADVESGGYCTGDKDVHHEKITEQELMKRILRGDKIDTKHLIV